MEKKSSWKLLGEGLVSSSLHLDPGSDELGVITIRSMALELLEKLGGRGEGACRWPWQRRHRGSGRRPGWRRPDWGGNVDELVNELLTVGGSEVREEVPEEVNKVGDLLRVGEVKGEGGVAAEGAHHLSGRGGAAWVLEEHGDPLLGLLARSTSSGSF